MPATLVSLVLLVKLVEAEQLATSSCVVVMTKQYRRKMSYILLSPLLFYIYANTSGHYSHILKVYT